MAAAASFALGAALELLLSAVASAVLLLSAVTSAVLLLSVVATAVVSVVAVTRMACTRARITAFLASSSST